MGEYFNCHRLELSILRVTCTIAIICLHMCAILVEHPDLFSMSGLQELILTTVRNYFKGFLPVFFMITGVLLFIEKLTGIEFYFSIPIVSFPVFYLLFGRYIDDADVNIPAGGLFAGLVIFYSIFSFDCIRCTSVWQFVFL